METFFDYDKVECVTIEEAQKEYPYLDWKAIEVRFSWGMGEKDVNVMALADLNLCVKLHERGEHWDEYEYTDIAHCSVCREVLLPDSNDCYRDNNGDNLCDKHSAYNELEGYYYKFIF